MKRIINIIIVILVSSIAFGKALDFFYKKHWTPIFEKLDTVFIDSSCKDIVCIGDSRIHLGINPYYIDSITKLNSYNIGMGGASINEVYYLTQAWLNNHKAPKLFICSVSPGLLSKYNTLLKNPCFYFFYLKDKNTLKTLSDLHYHTSLFKYHPAFKYTAFDEYDKTCILRSIKGDYFLKKNGISYKGFLNNASTNAYIENNNSDSVHEDVDKLNYSIAMGLKKLNNLIELIHKNKSKIVFIITPNINFTSAYGDSISKKTIYDIEKTAKINDIKIWHFETDSSFKKEYFQDPIHLNIEGSIHLSKKIGLNIKQIINDSL